MRARPAWAEGRTYRLFLALYRTAFEAFRSGAEALLPFGSWLVRFRAPIPICDPA